MKPMLAAAIEDLSKIKFPVLASPKLDGIRCVCVPKINENGILTSQQLTRSLKPIPNKHIRNMLQGLVQYDGELIIPGKDFNEIQSAVMSEEGEPEFEYHVFDYIGWDSSGEITQKPFKERIQRVYEANKTSPGITTNWRPFILPVPHTLILNLEELLIFEKTCVKQGYEGVMIRSPDGPYKFGRSTLKEGYLLKLKRFKDAEAMIHGFTERMHNANEAFKDELGHTKRSSHKANKIGTNMLGAFKVVNYDGDFEIGTGFTEAQRIEYWAKRDQLIEKYVKFKYQELSKEGIPRFPVFLGFRDPIDMS